MRAGTLRHRLSLTRRASGQDSVGQPNGAFVEYAEVWAEASQPGGREFFNAERFVAEVQAIFRIRYRTDVLPLDRAELSARSQTYEILQVVDPDMRARDLLIGCKMVQ